MLCLDQAWPLGQTNTNRLVKHSHNQIFFLMPKNILNDDTSEKLPFALTDCTIVSVVTHTGLQCPYVIMCSVRDYDSIIV